MYLTRINVIEKLNPSSVEQVSKLGLYSNQNLE